MSASGTTITLAGGVSIPQVGFGVFRIPDQDTESAVLSALDAGYRHVDTAQMYGNEAGVGRAIAGSGLDRADAFVTTKLHNDRHDDADSALDESLDRLGMDHVDLYLIHWPVPDESRYLDTWRALHALSADGRTRSIGVSNLGVEQLDRLVERTGIVPAVNQVEVHPNHQQIALRHRHRALGVVTEAWSPIARGKTLTDATVGALAEKYGVTPAQLVLRWHVQLGNVLLSKSSSPARMRENLDLFGFELAEDDMATIAALDGDPNGAPSRTAEAAPSMPYWMPDRPGGA